jgi:hypothetical protein
MSVSQYWVLRTWPLLSLCPGLNLIPVIPYRFIHIARQTRFRKGRLAAQLLSRFPQLTNRQRCRCQEVWQTVGSFACYARMWGRAGLYIWFLGARNFTVAVVFTLHFGRPLDLNQVRRAFYVLILSFTNFIKINIGREILTHSCTWPEVLFWPFVHWGKCGSRSCDAVQFSLQVSKFYIKFLSPYLRIEGYATRQKHTIVGKWCTEKQLIESSGH